jgi:putative PEP-CTERM system TPR-repeat lipoprotein
MRIIGFVLLLFVMLTNVSIAQKNIDYEKAFSAYELGNIDDSYIHLRRSLGTNPDHLPSKLLMAEVLALSGYYIDAMSEFEESIAQGADLNIVLESYIRVLLVVGDYGKILDIPETQLTPLKMGFLRSAKGTAYATKEEHLKASEYYQRAYQIAPKSTNVLNSSARYYLMRDNLKLAKTRLNESLLINSENSNTYELLAEYYGIVNNTDKQIEALRRGLSIADSHPVILRELVSAFAEQGKFSQAKAVLNKTLQTSPNDPMASLLLSWVAAQLNENELSKNTLTTLVNNLSLIDNSDLAQQDYTLFVSAMANYAANNLEIARAQLEQYVTRNPKNFEAARILVDIFEREGSLAGASNTLERFPKQVDADINLIAKLCSIYIKANLNHKCNSLLDRNRRVHGESLIFVQTESSLLAARGKLNLALDNLAKLGSRTLSVMAQKAVIAIQDNQLDLASQTVSELLSRTPNNSDFLNLKASIFKKQNRFLEAEEVYRRVLVNDADHFAANFNLTHIYYLTNRLGIAKDSALNLMGIRENDVDLLVLYGNILVLREEYEDAFDVITQADALSRGNNKVEEAFIELYIATQELDKALVNVNNLIKGDLTNVRLIRQRAALLFELGREQDAQQDLRILFGLLSDDSQSLFALSDIQGQYADIEGALDTLKRADLINPGNLFINRNIAKLAMTKKDRILAAEKINWLKTVAPNNADILLLQGDLASFDGKDQEAAKHYLNAIRVNSKLAPALIGAYQLAQRGIKEPEFVEVFAYLASSPENNVFSTHLLADFYYSRDRMLDAKNAYISISGNYNYTPIPMVLNNLANVYLYENKIDAAYNFAQQAYELAQREPAILDTLGWITILRGEYYQGLSLLREAYSMNAQDPNLRYHLAFALYKLDRNAESRRELDVLLSDFTNFEKRVDAIALQALIQ